MSMSELRQYLEFVRPWDDNSHKVVTTQWDALDASGQPIKRMMMRGAVALDDVISIITYYDDRGQNVWFSTQTFAPSSQAVAVGNSGRWFKQVNRKQQHLRVLHVFHADLDVKAGGYATLQDAVNAIYAFCAKLNLPPPSLCVCSGYGLHVYWRIEEDVTPQQWLALAAALRNAMIAEGIHADHQCTIDGARILRPAGTRNWKDPNNPVWTYIIPGSTFNVYKLADMEAALAPFRGPHLATLNGQSVAPSATASGVNQNLMAGVGAAPPVDLREVATECPVFEEQFRLHGANASQPLWSLVAMASAFDRTPWDTFRDLSDGYANYDENAARQKLAEKMAIKGRTGWPSCNTFASESLHCQTCPHFSAGKSPLNLKAKPVVNPTAIPGAPCSLPSPYWQEQDGTIWGNVPLTDKGAAVPTQVIRYPVAEGGLDDDNGDLVFKANIWKWTGKYIRVRMDKVKAAEVRQQLSAQGMESQEFEAKRLGAFVMAWVTHLKAQKARTIQAVALGWNEDGSFTHGETTWIKGSATRAYFRDDSLVRHFMVKGSAEPWQQLMDEIYSENLPSMETVVATSFGAPLVGFVSEGSVMLSPYSPMSSAGKSTSMKAGMGVWGDPVHGISSLDDTTNFVNKKVSDLRNLPLYWDEIQTKKLLDQLVLTVFRLSQGKDRGRLQADLSTRQGNSHATMMVACSNHSLSEQVTNATIDTNAGASRILEVLMPDLSQRTGGAQRFGQPIIAMQHGNFGHAGAAYAEWLSAHRKETAKQINDFNTKLTARLGAPANERFWMATISAIVCGATFANQAGITRFNVSGILNFLVQGVINLRRINASETQSVSSADKLEQLVNDIINSGEVIFTNYLSGKGAASRGQIDLAAGQQAEDVRRMQKRWAQFAVHQDTLRVSVPELRRWVSTRGHSPRIVIEELMKRGAIETKASIGAGLRNFGSFGVTRTYCLEIPMVNIRTP